MPPSSGYNPRGKKGATISSPSPKRKPQTPSGGRGSLPAGSTVAAPTGRSWSRGSENTNSGSGRFSVGNTPGMSSEDRLAAADKYQKEHMPGAVLGGPGHRVLAGDGRSTKPDPTHELGLADYLAMLGGNGTDSGGGDSGMADLHAGFDAQKAAIEAQYGAHIENLDRNFQSGSQGVDRYSQDLQNRVGALGQDARGEGKRITGAIEGVYAQGQKQHGANENALMSRLRKAGVGGADLASFAGASNNNATFLRSQGMNESGHQQRQASLLQQMLNDRKFEGSALQAGAKNDLSVGLANAKSAAEAQRAASQGDLAAAEASATASQKAAAAKSDGKAGMSVSDLNTLWKMTGGGQKPKAGKTPDFESAFKSILGDTKGDFSDDEKNNAMKYLDDLTNGMSPAEAIASFEKSGGDTNSATYRALKAAQRENRRVTSANSGLQGDGGGMSLTDLLPILLQMQ